MASKYKNGDVLVTLRKTTEGLHHTLNVHENGHILAKRPYGGWRQWAIVPVWGLGNVVEYIKSKGYVDVS